ncbi:lytic murein transglycosylase [Aquabacter spiritensis]|uniref:Lytic murein transglycosylase n=1 Tax=Aquabacter spiritensis TaxID=933073 RepID=A0A4R3M1S4_9HYPH|nr:lytic murein transglycosylase [Aquabacter spiritensis]TCT05117.1 lytic murein transglycosylase [Aquabacter spiritensis]
MAHETSGGFAALAFGLMVAMGAAQAQAQVTGSIFDPPDPPAAAPRNSHPLMAPQAIAAAEANFGACVANMWPLAQAKGVSRRGFEHYTAGLEPDMKIMDFLDSQPEFSKPLGEYVDMLVSERRVAGGREVLARYKPIFDAVERKYGVDRYVIAAIWGIESNYGSPSGMGSRSVLRSTATLACIGRRQDYFRDEFVATLQILDKGDVPAEHMKGSWAGAFGPTQFMPTSFQRFAVDFDGDGKRNVVDSVPDVIASTANNLKIDGWEFGKTWGYEVQLPANFDYRHVDRSKRYTLAQWASLGIRRPGAKAFPRPNDTAFLLLPAGSNGPAFLMLPNFSAILKYNPADAYALAIGHLSDRLRGGGDFAQAWPKERALSRSERVEMQTLLIRQGYDVGSVDGILGQKTRSAVQDFQMRTGMVPDGYPNVAVLQKLRN